MRCCDVEALWDDLREFNANSNEPAFVHLRSCPTCREVFRLNERLAACLSNLAAAEPPADLVARVREHIRRSHAPRSCRVDGLAQITSPIGTLYVAFHEQRISYVALDRGESVDELAQRILQRLGHRITVSEAPEWLVRAVEHFFETWSMDCELLDKTSLTAFESAALQQTARIPPGEVRSYGWIAEQIGKPQAARAVGRAMARNPLALFFPCHRVVDASGELHNYSFGLELKARILEMEGYRCDQMRARAKHS